MDEELNRFPRVSRFAHQYEDFCRFSAAPRHLQIDAARWKRENRGRKRQGIVGTAMNDWQLIEAYRTGDEDAFATLARRYYSLVYGAACRQVSDTHLAEDITQCVFLLFARKINGLSPATAIGGWFLRTVRFVAKDVIRKSRHWQRLENEDELIEIMENPHFDPVGPLASLEEALLSLAPKEQTCLLAKYYEGKSFKEIGADLNISEDAVEKRVARGLEKMRGFFKRRGLKVSTATIPMVVSAGFLMAKGAGAADTGPSAVLAAVKGKAVSSNAAAMTVKAAKLLIWKKWMAVATAFAASLTLGGAVAGWFWVNHKPAVPERTAFQINDPRILILGKSWNHVMQRAAIVRHEFPRTPRAEDSRVPALREENISLFRDRMALAWGLRSLDQEDGARILLPGYITCGLSELLEFNPAQQAFAFDIAQKFLPPGIKEEEASSILETNKPAMVGAIRDHLSIRQRWRFDQICGRNGEFLLINRTSYGRAPGYIAWQDWLGGGGIITPQEAMDAVPPNLW
jgi:RNA polymerase sigma factor (sigma-70 family)